MTDPQVGRLFTIHRIREMVRPALENEFAEELGGGAAPRGAVVEMADGVAAEFVKRLQGVHRKLAWEAEVGVYRLGGGVLPTSEKQLRKLLHRAVDMVFPMDATVVMNRHFAEAETILRGPGEDPEVVLLEQTFTFEMHPSKFGQDMARELVREVALELKGDLRDGPRLFREVNRRRLMDTYVIERMFDMAAAPEAKELALRAYWNLQRAVFPSVR